MYKKNYKNCQNLKIFNICRVQGRSYTCPLLWDLFQQEDKVIQYVLRNCILYIDNKNSYFYKKPSLVQEFLTKIKDPELFKL